jgi:hypothetical protein
MNRNIPRTEEGRVSLVAEGGTINESYGLPPGEALEAFRADLKVLVERPTVDAWSAACRALHWRTAELRHHGIEPIRLPADAAHYPPEGYDFGHGPATDIAFLLSVIDSCDEAGAPSCEMEPEDVANIARIRAAYP